MAWDGVGWMDSRFRGNDGGGCGDGVRGKRAHLSVSPAKAGVHVFVFGGVGVDSPL